MSESTMTIDNSGNRIWRDSKGHHHRTDGPAIEWNDGHKEWWINGKRHRINGPAFIWSNNRNAWYINNKFLGYDEKGFWKLWDTLTDEQKKDPVLLTYLPEKF